MSPRFVSFVFIILISAIEVSPKSAFATNCSEAVRAVLEGTQTLSQEIIPPELLPFATVLGKRTSMSPVARAAVATKEPAQVDLAMLLTVHQGEIAALFQSTTRSKFLRLAEQVENNQIPLSPEVRSRFLALADLVRKDTQGDLWKSENPAQLILTQIPEMRGASSEGGLGGTLAGVDTYGITRFEQEIIDHAINGNKAAHTRVGRGGPIKRFFQPLYPRVKKILGFNNWVRRRLDFAEELQNLVMTSSYEINPSDRAILTEIAGQVRELVREVNRDVELVYGQDVSRGVQFVPGLDIYVFAKRIPKVENDSGQSMAELITVGERLCDVIHNSTRRQRGGRRSLEEFYDPELKIRNQQYHREGEASRTKQTEALAESTGLQVNIDYKWQEIEIKMVEETYIDANKVEQKRKVPKPEIVTKYGNKDIEVTYSELLIELLKIDGRSVSSPGTDGKITAVYDVNGLLKSSKETSSRERENLEQYLGLKEKLDHWIEQYSDLLIQNAADSSVGRSVLQEISAVIAQTQNLLAETTHHSKLSDAEVRSLWEKDSIENFRRRNLAIKEAVQNLHDRLLIFKEQFRRQQPELWIVPDLADYSPALKSLWWQQFRARAAQTIGVAAGAVYGAASAHAGGLVEGWQLLVDMVTSILGN